MPYQSGFRDGLFSGSTVFIPGGGGGLGRCIAHEVAALGGKVVLAGRTLEKLDRTRVEIEQDGGVVLGCYTVELRDESQVQSLVARVLDAHGLVHGLVNTAGGQFPAALEDLSLNGWNAVLGNNLTSYFLTAREVYKQCMTDHGGSIVNIGADWEGGMAGMGHNGAARAGLSNFTATAASEWGRDGVRVNCVIPGFIATTGLERYPRSDWEAIRNIDKRVPLGRHGTAAEISAMVVFLLSELSAYVTGVDIRVDGGIHNGAGSFVYKPGPPRNIRRFEGFHRDEPPSMLSD
ncbi:MAG: SDR family oxidoreductase [Pseudomonadales bacterium]|nr:SDR family oxidoreductase [Pseudomonadales bacterium]MDP6469686.1 SDR family oxidoreductase [Pseudomonadales bacterium]MDP6828927.1 SDR family oxidoreductase [Pseudomonadales bacterium]MDP6972727.1 SDR family oxidoreductase [Pseudomonadales bacterium]